MSAMGQDLDSTIALFTGANEVLQDPATTGTALRSMALRMRGFDEETEQVSEELTNITGEIIDLTKTAEHAQGVSIFTDATQTKYKDFVDYFRELSEVWDEMSAKNQTALLNDLFGKRGAQAGSALIKNFATVDKALQAMQNSAGNAEKEMGIITESLSYKINALKETGTGIAQNLFARKDIGIVVDGLTQVLSLVDALTSKLGLFGTIGAAGGLFAFFKNLSTLQNMGKVATAFLNIGSGATGVSTALAGMTAETIGATVATVGFNAVQAAQIGINSGVSASETAKMLAIAGFSKAEAEAAMISVGYSASQTGAATTNLEFAGSAIVGSTAANTFATSMYNLAAGVITFLATNPIGWFLMFAAGAAAVVATVDALTLSYEEAKEKADESAGSYESVASEAESLKARIDANNESINKLKAQGTLSLTDQADLANLEAQNKSLENQYAIKQKMANMELKQAGQDAYTALTTKKSYSTGKIKETKNGYGQTIGTVEEKRGDILDETIDKYNQLKAAEEEYLKLEAEQAKLDPEKDKKAYEANAKRMDVLSQKQDTLSSEVSQNLTDITGLYSTLSTANSVLGGYDDELAKIENTINAVTSDTDKAASKQEKINNILKDSKYADAANDMLEYAKAQGEAGITGDDIRNKFGDIADAAQEAGVDIDDLAQTINAMTGSVNIEEVTKQLNDMKDSLEDSDTKDFLDNLFSDATDEELKMYYSIMQTNETGSWSIEDWQNAIEQFEDQKIVLTFDIEAETERLSDLRDAYSDSRSNTGLSQSSIDAIRTSYGELEGFDESKVFYNTANGVRANSKALKDLQRQYVNLKKEDLNEQLEDQVKAYNKAKEALNDLKEGTTAYQEASDKVDFLKDQIDDTNLLISQYSALTSAYNEWIAAQEAGAERDMYQNAASGYESTGKLIEQGWVNDDSVQAYIDLMTYGEQASFSAEEVKSRYAELGKTIEGTSYSVKDFFMTLDEEGNATVDETTGGIDNFVSALKELGTVGSEGVLDASKANEYAEVLGVDVSLVETMIRAAEEAGYTVNNTWASTTATLSEVNTELETAKQSLEQFRNEDGSFNVNAEGFEEAQQKVTELIAKKQELEQVNGVMSIDLETSGFDEGVSNAIAKLQELQTALNQYESLKAAGIDTSEAEANIASLAQEIEGLDPEIKAQVGLEEGSDLASQISSLAEGSEVEVGAKLSDGAGAEITSALNGLNAEVIVTATTSGQESVDGLSTSVDQVKDKTVSVTANVNGQSAVDKLNSSINSLKSRTVTETANVIGAGSVSSLLSNINSLSSKTITITTNYVTNGSPSGGGGFSGNAYASGTWGGGLGGTTLVGELAKEMVVTGFCHLIYLIAGISLEIRILQRSDEKCASVNV